MSKQDLDHKTTNGTPAKKPGLIRRYHRAHVAALKKIANLDGMKRIVGMASDLGKAATTEACPRCQALTMPALTDQEAKCSSCGFVRPAMGSIVTEDDAKKYSSQFDDLTDQEYYNILQNHVQQNRMYLLSSMVVILIAAFLAIFSSPLYAISSLLLAITLAIRGLKCAYWYWIALHDRLYNPNNLRDWMSEQLFWLAKSQVKDDFDQLIQK